MYIKRPSFSSDKYPLDPDYLQRIPVMRGTRATHQLRICPRKVGRCWCRSMGLPGPTVCIFPKSEYLTWAMGAIRLGCPDEMASSDCLCWHALRTVTDSSVVLFEGIGHVWPGWGATADWKPLVKVESNELTWFDLALERRPHAHELWQCLNIPIWTYISHE